MKRKTLKPYWFLAEPYADQLARIRGVLAQASTAERAVDSHELRGVVEYFRHLLSEVLQGPRGGNAFFCQSLLYLDSAASAIRRALESSEDREPARAVLLTAAYRLGAAAEAVRLGYESHRDAANGGATGGGAKAWVEQTLQSRPGLSDTEIVEMYRASTGQSVSREYVGRLRRSRRRPVILLPDV